MRDQDKDLARTFDGMSRSKAFERAAWMRHFNLITDEEFADFSRIFKLSLTGFSTVEVLDHDPADICSRRPLTFPTAPVQ